MIYHILAWAEAWAWAREGRGIFWKIRLPKKYIYIYTYIYTIISIVIIIIIIITIVIITSITITITIIIVIIIIIVLDSDLFKASPQAPVIHWDGLAGVIPQVDSNHSFKHNAQVCSNAFSVHTTWRFCLC